MTRKENEKRFQFVRLCASLTKQGFNFTVDKTRPYHIVINKVDNRRLSHYKTKLPFVDSVCRSTDHNSVKFNQWADRHVKF